MKRILIVDDVAANRRLLRAVLEAEGLSIQEASDGVDALALLERETIDAIVSDVLMPNMDGLRLCLEVRRSERFSRLPFIIYTSTYNSPADRKLALEAGADDYLVKPAPTNDMLAALARAEARAAAHRDCTAPAGAEFEVIKRYNAVLIAKLEERNAELQASEERFRELAESISEVFWLAEPARRRILYVSPAFRQIWGRSPESVCTLPETWTSSIHEDDRCRVEQAATKQVEGTYHEEYRVVRPDGSIRWIRDRAFPVRHADGSVYRIAGVAEDITERKQLEARIRRAQKMESIGTLAGGIAHDFNNILSAINGYTTLARMHTRGNPVVCEHLQSVLEASRRATDLVGQILACSNRQESPRQLISLRHVVAEAIKLLRVTMPPTIEFDIALSAAAPAVLADPTQVHQVVMNLGTNAAHAMRGRKGRLRVQLEEVRIEAGASTVPTGLVAGTYTRLTVSDTGHGIDRPILDRIFDPFFTTKPTGEGTGLGLAVVHGIMQSHDGAVTVDSRPGEGSTFHLYFPARTSAVPEATAHPSDYPRGSGERILVVDDEVSVGQVTMLILRQLGYAVHAEPSPLLALEAVRAQPEAYDAVLTDLTMPRMMGTELAMQLHQVRPDLPVLLFTGYLGTPSVDKIRESGVCAVLEKPLAISGLAHAMHRALKAVVAS